MPPTTNYAFPFSVYWTIKGQGALGIRMENAAGALEGFLATVFCDKVALRPFLSCEPKDH